MPRFDAERAARIADQFEHDTITMTGLFLSDPVRYATAVIAADDDRVDRTTFTRRVMAAVTPTDAQALEHISTLAAATPGEDLIAVTRWAQHRVVYVVDPDTADALETTDWHDTVIPGDVLRRLPHPNPMVVLPTPIRIPDDNGTIEKYDAFIVLGVAGYQTTRRRANTHAPDIDGLILHFLGRVVDPVTDRPVLTTLHRPNGSAVTTPQIVGMRIVVSLEDATMSARQDAAIVEVLGGDPSGLVGFTSTAQVRDVTARLCNLGLALLTYLVSDGADLSTRTTRTPRRRQRTRAAATGTTVVEAGYHVGAALRAARRTDTAPTSPTGASTRTVRPHLRRAHLHTFRCGPGRRDRIIRWLPPLAVAYRHDTAPVTTVHHADPPTT